MTDVSHPSDDAATQVADGTDAASRTATPADAEPRRRWRFRRPDRGILLASLAIAFGLVLVIRGLAVGITGDERAGLPDLVEEVEPVPEAVQVLSQTRVFVDLADGYTGVLVIDGVEIETVDIQEYAVQDAGRQVDLPPVTIFEGGNNTLTFIPNEDAPVDEFATGLHRVQVIYWDIEIGRERSRSFSWTFDVV